MTSASDDSTCSTCPLSRRGFPRGTSLAALGTAFLPRIAQALGPDLGGTVDVHGLRPSPKVSVLAAILRRQPPYWLGRPGSSYDLEAHQREYTDQLGSACLGLDIDLEITEYQFRMPPESMRS